MRRKSGSRRRLFMHNRVARLEPLEQRAMLSAYYVNSATANTATDLWCTAVGNDSAGTGTQAAPYATVQGLLAKKTLVAGDTVYIDTGTYTLTSDTNITASGASSASPITFIASPYGVTINRNSTSSTYAWNITGSYVTLTTYTDTAPKYANLPQSYMQVTGANTGIKVSGAGDVISQVDVTANLSYGIYVTGASTTIQNSITIQDCIIRGTTASGGKGIYETGSLSAIANLTVTNCTIANNGGASATGVQVYEVQMGGNSATYTTLTLLNNIIYYNPTLTSNEGIYDYPSMVSLTSDYNDIDTPVIGYRTTGETTLAAWRTASGQENASTFSSTPPTVLTMRG